MNETFVTVVDFGKKPVFVSEVYTRSQRVMKEARRRGRKCGTAMSLENGWAVGFLHIVKRQRLRSRRRSLFSGVGIPCVRRLLPTTTAESFTEVG